jgi:hypothetical protein
MYCATQSILIFQIYNIGSKTSFLWQNERHFSKYSGSERAKVTSRIFEHNSHILPLTTLQVYFVLGTFRLKQTMTQKNVSKGKLKLLVTLKKSELSSSSHYPINQLATLI